MDREAAKPARAGTKKILIVSSDPALTQWKKQVLEGAGYIVIAAPSIEQVSRTCRKYKIDLIILGSSLSPAEKRKFWLKARSNCPVLELYGSGAPELMDEIHTPLYASHGLSNFVEAVRAILDQH